MKFNEKVEQMFEDFENMEQLEKDILNKFKDLKDLLQIHEQKKENIENTIKCFKHIYEDVISNFDKNDSIMSNYRGLNDNDKVFAEIANQYCNETELYLRSIRGYGSRDLIKAKSDMEIYKKIYSNDKLKEVLPVKNNNEGVKKI